MTIDVRAGAAKHFIGRAALADLDTAARNMVEGDHAQGVEWTPRVASLFWRE
jgi:hypothetical protein